MVGGWTLAVRMTSTVQHLIIAYRFGTADTVDAFLMAYAVPALATSIIGGALHASFLPAYVNVRRQYDGDSAAAVFSEVLAGCLLLVVCIGGLLAFSAPLIFPYLCSGFSQIKLDLTQELFYCLLPIVMLGTFSALSASALNAHKRFSLAAAAPAAIPAVTIFCLLLFGMSWGIYALVYGILCGTALEALLFVAGIHRGHIIRWKLPSRFSRQSRQVARQFFPMAAGAILMNAGELIDKSMASMLDPGSVSALSYGGKPVAFVLGVGAYALGTAVFPHFAEQVAAARWQALRRTLKVYSGRVLVVSLPLTVVLFLFSVPITGWLFERGAFLDADTRSVAQVQAFYALQMPFYVLGTLGVRLLSALKKNHVLMAISAVNLVTNIAGNLVFMRFWGSAGIALSTSCVYFLSMILIFSALMRSLKA